MNTMYRPEFDVPFTVADDLTVVDRHDLYAPTVMHDRDDDVTIDDTRWTPLSGYTGQYGYSGACMHRSEYFGGRLAIDVLTTPGTYVLTVVDFLPDDGDDAYEFEPAGWAVLRFDA